MSMKIPPKELVVSQLLHKETVYIPYVLPYEESVGERLDKHYGSTCWREKIVDHINRVQFFDSEQYEPVNDNLVRDIYGSEWRIDVRPKHMVNPAITIPSFDGYKFPSVEQLLMKRDKNYELKFCQEHKNKFLAISFGSSIFERTWQICGYENALVWAVSEPDFYDELLERIFQIEMGYIEEFLKLPIDGIMFSDDWGDQRGVILGPERWRKFLKPRLAKLYERVHKAGKFTLSHCCGSIVDIMSDIIEVGLDVLQSVQPEARGMNPYDLKNKYGKHITFWGGLGSQSIIPFGTSEQIRLEVKKLCSEMGNGGGYILSPAKPILSDTPIVP